MLRSIKYGLYGLVLAGLIATPVLIAGGAAVSRTVHLVVDGQATTFRTTATRVGDVLGAKRLRPTGHDIVAPAAATKVRNGMSVVLRRGRLLHLDVDGKRVDVWTTAPTVAVALSQLGYSQADFVSVSRSRRLPLSATAITIRSLREVALVHDGRTDRVSTSDLTVSQLLASLGVKLGANDRLSVPVTSALSDGQTIQLQRVGSKIVVQIVPVKFGTQQKNDATLALGDTQVLTKGHDGASQIYYSVLYVDGKIAGRTKVRTTITTKAQDQIIAVGTKRTEVPAPTGGHVPTSGSSPDAAKQIAKALLAERGWSDQFSCLDNMWRRESGWRVRASNGGSGAYGIPQALPGSKMASAGPNWQTSAETQIKWGLNYIASRYHDPCGAWSFWQGHNWY